jgi:FkbM family methyltransferase
MPPPAPPPSRKSWGRVRGTIASFAQMAGWRARAKLLAAKLGPRIGRGRGEAVALPVKELDGRPLHVRPGTADMNTIFLNYIQGAHLPPPPFVERDLHQICELGSQIGTGIAGLAARYPRARVLGVEPDSANAALARQNVAPFGDRCVVVETAIWDAETELTIEGEWVSGFTVRPATATDSPERRVRATTVDRLLAEHLPEGQIDYMVMNLEHTEPRILAAADSWAPRVASIRCEIYPGKGFEGAEAVALLERLGFEAWWEPRPSLGWAFGVRRDR